MKNFWKKLEIFCPDFRNLEREQMTEEILQLRKKLDDLLPTLTKKEVQLAEMQVELQEAYGRINAAKNAFAVLKQQVLTHFKAFFLYPVTASARAPRLDLVFGFFLDIAQI